MRKLFVLLIGLSLVLYGCGSKDKEVVKLEKETAAYQLAKELSEKLDYLDPDKNNVLVTSKNFDISVGEVVQKLYKGAGQRTNGLKQMSQDQLKNYFDQIAERFGEQKLLLTAAEKEGIQIDDAKVDSILQGQFMRAGGEEKFEQMLSQSGVTIDFVKKDIRRNLIINEYLQKQIDQSEISEEKLKEYYNDDKTATVRHILLTTRGKNDSEKQAVREKMEDILNQAKSGKDFAELAKQYSEDPSSKDKGGLFENFEKGTMVKSFEEAAFSTPIGEISDIVETRYGFHIIKVLDREKETKPFEDVREEISDKIKNANRSEKVQNHLQELKDKVEFKVVEY